MRIVMLTDDKQIDRRIILEAETLSSHNHEVIILAPWEDGLKKHETCGNIKIERIQLVKSFNIEYILTLFCALQVRGINWLSKITQLGISKISASIQRLVQLFFGFILKGCLFIFRNTCIACNGLGKIGIHIIKKIKNRSEYDEMLYKRACYYNPDIIHVHDLPQLRAGTLVKKKLNIPLIYDAHELYPEISTLSKYHKKNLSKLEYKLITKCDEVITVNPFIANEMVQRYKINLPHVILNATKIPEQFSLNKKYDLFREHLAIPKDKKILLFQGWMSKSRGLQTLIQAMQDVPSEIHLVLMGYGEALPELQTLTASLHLEDRVHFHKAVPQEELLYWTASADVGIIPYQPVDLNNYYCSPNKLFEFIQARIPIVANDLPFLRQIVHDEGIGIVMPLTCQKDYAMAIKKIFEKVSSESNFKNKLNTNAKKYHWDVEEQKLNSIYTQLITSIKGKSCVV